jgi:hypothetical protein
MLRQAYSKGGHDRQRHRLPGAVQQLQVLKRLDRAALSFFRAKKQPLRNPRAGGNPEIRLYRSPFSR